MIKAKIIQKLLLKVKKELLILEAAHSHIADGINNPESKQEGKYDTRALLESYLAGGQEARIKQLKYEIKVIEESTKDDQSSRLILLKNEDTNEVKQYLFLPCLGGYQVELALCKVQTITTKTPIAKLFSGKEAGDMIEKGFLKNFVIQKIT